MKAFARKAVSTVTFLGLLAGTTLTGGAEPGAKGSSFHVESKVLEALLAGLAVNQKSILAALAKAGGPTYETCASATCGPYDVTIIPSYDTPASGAKQYGCLVLAKDIQFHGAKGKRTITINLKPPTLATYEFTDKPILLVYDDGTTKVDGTSSGDNQQMQVVYNYPGEGNHGRDFLYFLLVIQNRLGANPFLCGVGDPKIVNN